MAKLDRLGWAAGFAFRAHGLTVGVRLNDAALVDDVRARLPMGAREQPRKRVDVIVSLIAPVGDGRPGVRRFYMLYVDSARVSRTFEPVELFNDVERYLEEAVIANAPRRLFLHAGVVGWKGRALVLPGASRAGKTTLVAELLRRGATYYSDEHAVLDELGRVYPFARPLQVRRKGDVIVERVPPEALGARVGRRPLPVALVALLSWRRGARLRVRDVPPGRAGLELMRHVPAARLQPLLSLQCLPSLARRARVIRGVRGRAAEAADHLLELLEAA